MTAVTSPGLALPDQTAHFLAGWAVRLPCPLTSLDFVGTGIITNIIEPLDWIDLVKAPLSSWLS